MNNKNRIYLFILCYLFIKGLDQELKKIKLLGAEPRQSYSLSLIHNFKIYNQLNYRERRISHKQFKFKGL